MNTSRTDRNHSTFDLFQLPISSVNNPLSYVNQLLNNAVCFLYLILFCMDKTVLNSYITRNYIRVWLYQNAGLVDGKDAVRSLLAVGDIATFTLNRVTTRAVTHPATSSACDIIFGKIHFQFQRSFSISTIFTADKLENIDSHLCVRARCSPPF